MNKSTDQALSAGPELRLVDDNVQSSEALNAIGKTCPKCQRVRIAADTVPHWQCPKCLVAYDKVVPKASTQRDRSLGRGASASARRSEPRSGSRRIWVAGVVFIAVAFAAWKWVPWPESAQAKAERAAAGLRNAEIEAASRRLDDNLRLDAAIARYGRGDDGSLLPTLTEFADRGSTRAMVALGLMHQNGRGVAKDHAQAMTWLRKAAAEGEPLAMVQLGWIFETGAGESVEPSHAAIWYQMAARQGHAPGLFSLARLYESGKGGDGTNPRKAYFLYAVASRKFGEQVEESRGSGSLTPYDRSGLGSAAAMLPLKKLLSQVDMSRMGELAAQWNAGMPFPD